jgi:drug/metabolite transporter (DMT)-like permease
MVRTLLIILAASAATAVGECFLSFGMRKIGQVNPKGSWWPLVYSHTIASDIYVLVGVGFLFLFFILYLIALSRADLTFVQPLTAASYIFTVVIARYALGEEVSLLRVMGIMIIVVGITLVIIAGNPRSAPI